MRDRARFREYMRTWVAARRAAYMADKACVRCGGTDSLELDHIDRATKIHHAIWSWAEPRRNAELAKCQVLCRSCHQVKSEESLDAGYRYRAEIVAAVREYGAHGMSCREIRSVTGMSTSNVNRIINGKTRRVRLAGKDARLSSG